jgi:hypothetical protein
MLILHRFKNQLLFLIILIVCTSPTRSWGQQNLFNVPSSEITGKNEIFFQQQFNFATFAGNGNTTLDYGLGNELEIGINVFNLDLYTSDGNYQNPHLLFNFQKGLKITDNYKMSFGTQSGLTPPIYHSTIEIPSFSYINNALDLDRWGKYYLGAYYANHAYAGPGDSFGMMAGVEYPLTQQVSLMGDIYTGNNNLGVSVLGVVFNLPSYWQLSFGAQLPVPGSPNDYGAVLEITKLKW